MDYYLVSLESGGKNNCLAKSVVINDFGLFFPVKMLASITVFPPHSISKYTLLFSAG